jgi:O-antigen/teichoic acid export membrane protein
MSKVRLRISGITSFISQVIGYVTGIVFTIMVSRRLSEKDFGAWAYVGTLISYAVIPTDLFGLWITRDSSRGKKVLFPAVLIHLPFFSPIH